MSSQSQSLVTVVIDGAPFGTWDTLSGGNTTASPNKRRVGGSRKEVVARARSTTEDLTVSRIYENARDISPLRALRSSDRVGRASVVVSEQPLDEDDVPFGTPVVYTGVLSSISIGDFDVTSDDHRMAQIGVTVTSVA